MKLIKYIFLLLIIVSSHGCEGFFGKKTDVDFIDEPVFDNRQVAYVPIQPAWDQFIEPVDIVLGFDELIYVADAGTEEIICLDQTGTELGRYYVPGLTDIAQDRSLDILALGITDTIIESTEFQLSTLFRINLKNGIYGLNNANLERKVVHPFYFKVSFNSGKDYLPEFTGIGILGDNNYYLSRSGPSNGTSQFGGPDDAILIFNSSDEYVSPVVVQTELGTYVDYFKGPSCISTLVQPPQTPFVSTKKDFIYGSYLPNAALKVVYIEVNESDNGISYTAKNLVTGDTASADGFLYDQSKFSNPVDISYSGDGSNLIFVLDSEKDSLYQFTSTGFEGVPPPPGAQTEKFLKVSFGGKGTELTQFDSPSGVAYLDQIVYVADKGNGRVLRFKLTTDFD